MRIKNYLLAALFALIMASTVRTSVAQALPTSCTFEFEGDAAIWDVSGTQVLDMGYMRMDFTYDVDAKGKITGHGSAYADLGGIDINTDFNVTGTVRKSGSVTRVTLTMKFRGTVTVERKAYRFTASVSTVGSVDAANGQLDCTMTVRVSVAGYSASEKVSVSYNLGYGVDGSWDMGLNGISESRGRIAGTGTILISGGEQYTFTLKGTYSAKTRLANLSLKGDGAAKGTSFTVKARANGGTLVLEKMNGKLLGQAVKK